MKLFFVKGDPLYTSAKYGCDESGNGTEEKPFKTLLKVGNLTLKLISA